MARDNLEAALGEQRKWTEWEEASRESLAIRQLSAPGDYHALRVKSNLWFALDQQSKAHEGEAIFHELLADIKTLLADFMACPNFKKNVTCEEEWYFWRLRNGSFDLETLRARKRVAAWLRMRPRVAMGAMGGGMVSSLESFAKSGSQARQGGAGDLAGQIYLEVLRNLERTCGRECEETRAVIEEYAMHLEQLRRIDEAKKIRECLQEPGD